MMLFMAVPQLLPVVLSLILAFLLTLQMRRHRVQDYVVGVLRNLLTLADGFFSFLVGAMLVALTENWQRLGDLAARTIVVVDERAV